MELEDIFLLGQRPITLRFVLGLMEEADNSLETYRWATPALLHSIHTKDTTLSDYVEEVFKRKGLTPYKPYKEEEKDVASEGNSNAKGDKLFCQKNHWWAVYRMFVDLQVCNIRENRYKEFIELIESLHFDHVNAELDMTTLSNITQDIYRFPFTAWEKKVPKDASARWVSSYTRMYQVAEALKMILIRKGF